MIYKVENARTIYMHDYVSPILKTSVPNNDTKNTNIKKDNRKPSFKKNDLSEEEKYFLFKGLLDESIEELKKVDKQKTK